MIPKIARILWIFPLIILNITGCKQQDTSSIANSLTGSLIHLSEGLDVQELLVLENEALTNPVIGLCYQEDTNSLFAVYDQSGTLAQWDVNSNLLDRLKPAASHAVSTAVDKVGFNRSKFPRF